MNPVFYEFRPEDLFIGKISEYPFPAHVHDPVEMVCVMKGRVKMTIGNRQYALGPGDSAIVFPSVTHSYDAVSDGVKGLAMVFSPETIGEFNRVFRTMMPAEPVLPADRQPGEMQMVVERLLMISEQQENSLRLGYMHLLLAHMLSLLTLKPLEKQMQTGLSYQVLHYISEHCTEPLSLESTARALGISRIHLSHIFSQQLKINFLQYINILRIDKARALLRDPSYSIAQVAYLCGYANPRTFHRAFLIQGGMPPKQFRSKQAEKESIKRPHAVKHAVVLFIAVR